MYIKWDSTESNEILFFYSLALVSLSLAKWITIQAILEVKMEEERVVSSKMTQSMMLY